jgi:hypothetical protein
MFGHVGGHYYANIINTSEAFGNNKSINSFHVGPPADELAAVSSFRMNNLKSY